MNILIDLLPKSVEISGTEYEINFDFRTSILFEMMIQDEVLSDKEKIIKTLELYYPVIPKDIDKNINEAIDKALWFYQGGKDIKSQKSQSSTGKSEKVYSFEYDDEYIYSAFLDQYAFDLQDVEELHWWKFKAMFKALKEDNEIVKIMGYRAMTIDNKMSKEQKEYYRKMKKLYEIPKSKNEIEKINAIEEALMGNGDLRGIL
ncbi:bacteriophage Gp15 family protein [Clostridium saccharoperbutylacetonicum]|uniref:bacteriophage Gp15 family protein n=1 Tax=Clostridium saccharoperbutylacetonicum TaxID=36745 RepID=UPI000983C7ED|nr:bacteriophage Gp15 family protein [Clostridium saccharoperbutylacetonicum]AQR93486.1 bacteriophage Gp15 protein [Clostridium saccharoperbutylacetonicum]NSB29184.1 hypothetical protein [Clostridium saccharoperbutylacetonicum]